MYWSEVENNYFNNILNSFYEFYSHTKFKDNITSTYLFLEFQSYKFNKQIRFNMAAVEVVERPMVSVVSIL